MCLLLILQPLLQAVYPLQQSFQNISLGPTFLRNCIYASISDVCNRDSKLRTVYARALEDLTRFTCRPQPIAFDLGKIISTAENLLETIAHLAFPARLAIHRFSGFVAHATDGQALDAHLWACRHGGMGDGAREEENATGETVTSLRGRGNNGSTGRKPFPWCRAESNNMFLVMLAGLVLLIQERPREEQREGLNNGNAT
jgi:hypothetical protein